MMFSSRITCATVRLWKILCSIRLTVVLILVLSGLSLVGIILIQLPQEISRGSSEYFWWLDTIARSRYGVWTAPLSFFGLLDVFHSPWFLGAGILLVVNVVICTLNRWKNIKRYIAGEPVAQAEEFFKKGDYTTELHLGFLPAYGIVNVIENIFKRHHYRIRIDKQAEHVYLAADRNRYFRLGTLLHHLGLIILIAGYIVSSYLSFRNVSFIVPEGATKVVGYNTGLSLYLQSFTDEYWPDGTAKAYNSQVVIYEKGKEVKQDIIGVNHPLTYKGIRFHQSFFGPAVEMLVRSPNGKVLFDNNVALSGLLNVEPFQRPSGNFYIPEVGMAVYLIAPALNNIDPVIETDHIGMEIHKGDSVVPVGWAKLVKGVPFKLNDLEFTYVRDRKYSGFQVSKDSGITVIWIGCGIFLLGVIMVFYFPYRRVWVYLKQYSPIESRLQLRLFSNHSFGEAVEFQWLVSQLRGELKVGNIN